MEMASRVAYATNVCRRDGDFLLRSNTLEDELVTHKGSFATQNKTGVRGSSLKFAFLY